MTQWVKSQNAQIKLKFIAGIQGSNTSSNSQYKQNETGQIKKHFKKTAQELRSVSSYNMKAGLMAERTQRTPEFS